MLTKSMLMLSAALAAAALVPAAASAKSGGGHGMGNYGGMNVSRQRAHLERPAFKFKLIKCHKHPRGNG